MFPTGMFETPTQRKILRVLSEKNRQYTTQELADMCHRSKPTVSRALSEVHRYPFIEKRTVEGSKRQVFGLDPGSEYAEPIREFFGIERRRERRNGTVPVEIWNLLEDVVDRLTTKFDQVVEVFLFGSYARGDYYVGSDVDLLLVAFADSKANEEHVRAVLGRIDTDVEIQLLMETVDPIAEDDEQLEDTIRNRAPVGDTEPLIPLIDGVEA